jgi:hypothetical protein
MHEPITINCHFSLLNQHTQSTRTENRHRKAERMCEKVIYKPQPSARGKITFYKASKYNFLILWGKRSVIIRARASVYTNPRKKPATSTKSFSSELHLNQLLQYGEFVDLHQININIAAQSVLRLAKGWTVRGSNTGGSEVFHTHSDWLWAHPASYTGVKRPRRGVDHPNPHSAEIKEKVQLHLYSPHDLHGLF